MKDNKRLVTMGQENSKKRSKQDNNGEDCCIENASLCNLAEDADRLEQSVAAQLQDSSSVVENGASTELNGKVGEKFTSITEIGVAKQETDRRDKEREEARGIEQEFDINHEERCLETEFDGKQVEFPQDCKCGEDLQNSCESEFLAKQEVVEASDCSREDSKSAESEKKIEEAVLERPKYYSSDGTDYLRNLSDELVFDSIITHLDFKELRKVAFLSKRFVEGLSYEAVLRCNRNRSRVKELLPMTECLPYSSIHVPSPVRLMRILCRRRCEQCLGELADDEKWPGLFLCSGCTQSLSAFVLMDVFLNKGWGCPEMTVMKEDSATLLARPIYSSVVGKSEVVGPVVTVEGLNRLVELQPELLLTLKQNPELLYESLAWRNTVHMIQHSVADPPSHHECDVFFRILIRYACGCNRCMSSTHEDCPNVMGSWEAFFSEH
mmetsp:Transcript_29325/g.44382  ORF Transcript_29325/g.44382 Transcript_29325/m.44382 type:complete len:438 (+) Transcript_29325:185-1498(+)|eukprot:CAMPEP_0178915268 /NCGR_PEP_ID=MMETSP0786-20121207/11927_1 /TAXON_ID=186022 /ORGANISM="Thalassionema frauenfeldii, Strain CCMP 1798" /LENGTH=437 /DNA_ID=CAMNT_0020588349 /DNA_START=116 /DNA_END=1429 /DNA_ORIENTATION=-